MPLFRNMTGRFIPVTILFTLMLVGCGGNPESENAEVNKEDDAKPKVNKVAVANVNLDDAQGKNPEATLSDLATFGNGQSRNMVNPMAKNVLTKWKVKGKKVGIKWEAELGTTTYGGIVVADGKIFIGTNNKNPRNPDIKGPKGVLMCFDQKTGKFLWQALHDMPEPDVVREALHDGFCGTPTVVGDKLYYVTPNAEIVCAKTSDGKALWTVPMREKYKVSPCYVSICSPMVVDGIVYVMTGNGAVNDDGEVPHPDGASFLAVSAKDGKKIWAKSYPGKNIIEGQWSNPAYATVNGKGQVIFAGGDSYLYGLDAKSGDMIWKFYLNSKADAKKQLDKGIPNYPIATPVIYKNRAYVGIGLFPGHFAGNKVSHFWCIDITKKGDVSPKDDNFDPKAAVNKDSALVWHFGGYIMPKPGNGERTVYFGKTVSTAAVHDGLVYISELLGYVHCLDAETGKRYWVHDSFAAIWGSPMWIDGHVYYGTEQGDVKVFAHGKEEKLVATNYMGGNLYGTPVAHGNTIYVTTRSKLIAIGE